MNFSSAVAHNPRKILLTGGTGLIGRKLGQELARRQHQLNVLSRSKAQLPYPAQVFHWDGVSIVAPEALHGVEAVIHLAGESVAGGRWTQARKAHLIQSRVETTRILGQSLRAVCARPLSVWINASAVGFYGDRGDEILDEDSTAGADFLARLCVWWEQALHEQSDLCERQVALRTGLVLARHGGALAQILPLFRYRLGGHLGSGQQWMSWIHLEDWVQLCLWALETPSVRGPLNAVAPGPVTNREWTRTLAQVLGVPAVLPAPAWLLRLGLGEMSQMLLASQRATPQAARLGGFQFAHTDLAASLRDLVL